MIRLSSRNQIFIALLIRVSLLLVSTGGFATSYFMKFFKSFEIGIDPWTKWIESGGQTDALPYGLVLFFLLSIVYLISLLTNVILGMDSFVFVLAFVIIACDLIVYKLLKVSTNSSASIIYLFSPLVIYINIIYLQTDAFVGLFMLIFSICLVSGNSRVAGIFLGLAIGSKFGVGIVLPFLIIFGAFNKRLRKRIRKALFFGFGIVFLSYLPAFWSPGFRQMVFATKGSSNLIEVSIPMGEYQFYLFPASFVLLCVWIYRRSRSSIRLVIGFIGSSLFTLGVFSESAIGWFLWGIPTMILVGTFTRIGTGVLFFVIQTVLILRDISSDKLTLIGYNLNFGSTWLANIFYTITIAIGATWTLSILRGIIEFSDPLNLVKRPISIAIAGDSGVGKDALVQGLCQLIGPNAVTVITGDSYHKHERGHQKWSVNTHLNPAENHLEEWQYDVRRAILRRDLFVKLYDHSNGRFEYQSPKRPNDLVVSQGLHALYPSNEELFDLKIFLEMDESLRIKFKMKRDASIRHHPRTEIRRVIKQRKDDYKKYIAIQKDLSHIIINQSVSKAGKGKVDLVLVETKDIKLAQFLYKSIKPFAHQIEICNSEYNSSILTIRSANRVNFEQLVAILQFGFNPLRDYFEIEESSEIPTGGLIAVISLLSVVYKRNEENQIYG